MPTGTVHWLDWHDGAGEVRADDGRLLRFHRLQVRGPEVASGDRVWFEARADVIVRLIRYDAHTPGPHP